MTIQSADDQTSANNSNNTRGGPDQAALQNAMFNSTCFSYIVTDANGIIQVFNKGAQQMLGYTVDETVGKLSPADFSDSQEMILRAEALSLKSGTRVNPGFEVLVFNASRAIDGVIEMSRIRKDGSRFLAQLSVTALRNDRGVINGYLFIGADITAHKATEMLAIRQTAIVASSADAIIVKDLNNLVTSWNNGAERIFGHTAGEILGTSVMSLIPEDRRGEAMAILEKIKRGETVEHFETQRQTKDGRLIDVQVTASPVKDAEGKVIGVSNVARDITDRKRADELAARALRELNNVKAALDEHAMVAITDQKGKITYVNDKFCAISKYTREELIGRDHRIINSGFHPKAFFCDIWQTISAGRVWKGEIKNRAKDGTYYWVDTTIVPYLGEDGKPVQYVAIRADITDRKQADQKTAAALRELNDVTAALDEHAIVAITDQKGRITYVNDSFCALSKYSREELIGQDHRIINSGFHPKEFIRDIWQTISAGRVWKGEIKNKARDGTFYWVDTTIVPYLGEDGKPVQYIAIRTDVTERKRFEQALQQTNDELESARFAAEKANLAKSDFLSSMSHELRTPLNAILGFAQLMESDDPPPTPSQTKSIAQILQAGWYLLKLINEILDLAVIESGKVPLSKESVSLAELMAECQAMMEPQAQQRGISMTFPRFEKPVFVSADRTRLKQILINLLSNAIKYNREAGTVVVDWVDKAPDCIRIRVRDTGEGLSPKKLAHLFQPFNRLGQENGSVPGTGIGLVVSRQLAELMGGQLGVESTPGAGSVFWCELYSAEAPQLEATDEETGEASPPAPGAQRRTLLYVEDNPANMKLVEELIARFPDLGLATAVNGTLGIQIARATQPRVIVMDINLPGISGIKALKILREDPVTAHIPVIALSANAVPREIARGMQAGFFSYLTKPIQIKEFMETLNAALESSAPAAMNTD